MGNDIVYESLPVNDFLEEIYPDPPMGPKEPLKKAYDRMLLSHYDIVRFKVHSIRNLENVLCYNIFFLFRLLDSFSNYSNQPDQMLIDLNL